jgi:hypothetical protein
MHHRPVKGAYQLRCLTDVNRQADLLPSLTLLVSPSGIGMHTRGRRVFNPLDSEDGLRICNLVIDSLHRKLIVSR